MKAPQLIMFLRRLFAVMFYGELLLFFGLMPLLLILLNFYPDVLLGNSDDLTAIKIEKYEPDKGTVPVGEAERRTAVDKLERMGTDDHPTGFSFVLEAKGELLLTQPIATTTVDKWSKLTKAPSAATLSKAPTIQLSRYIHSPPSYSLHFFASSWTEFSRLPWQALLLLIGTLSAFLSITLRVTYMAKHFFDGLSRHDYFGYQQIQRLRRIGWCFVGYGIFQYVDHLLTAWFVRHLLNEQGVGMSFQVIIGWPYGGTTMLVGTIILVLAQVFSYGRQLKLENELTV